MKPNELRLFTGAKRFHSIFEHEGSTYEIEVETPDLSDRTPSVWGDWGPMYTFEFDEPRTVRITYRSSALSVESEIEIPVQRMQLDSPMLYLRRQEHPLFLRFRDPSRGLKFEGYLDAQGKPAALEVKQFPLKGDVASLLLWHPPQGQEWHQAAATSQQQVA